MANQGPSTPDLAAGIQETAKKSGKPLEVLVARSFLEWGGSNTFGQWDVHLGTHFVDSADGSVRELDVLARRGFLFQMDKVVTVMEAVVSCKGFLDEDNPVSYSISQGTLPELGAPDLLHEFGDKPQRLGIGRNLAHALLDEIKPYGDGRILRARRIVGFDVFRDDPKQETGFRALGDRALFGGLDSALRASLYWSTRSLPAEYALFGDRAVRVQLPILVLSKPWYDIPIETGQVGKPEQTHWGFISNRYPIEPDPKPPTPLFCLVVSKVKLQELQTKLTEVFNWYAASALQAVRNPESSI